ncbi:MAG: hypothetical protein V4719_03545 [Planctomycetota bacterium]
MNTPDTPRVDLTPASTAAQLPPSHGGYERSDVKINALLGFFLAVGVSLVVAQFGLWELLKWFQADALNDRRPQSPLALSTPLPPEPRLQEQPLLDYSRFLERQHVELTSYGWIDRQQQTVRIPISRAIDQIVEHGLPKSAAPQPNKKPEAAQPSVPATK